MQRLKKLIKKEKNPDRKRELQQELITIVSTPPLLVPFQHFIIKGHVRSTTLPGESELSLGASMFENLAFPMFLLDSLINR